MVSVKFRDITESNLISKQILRLNPNIEYLNAKSVIEGKLMSLSNASEGAKDDMYCHMCVICLILSNVLLIQDHMIHPLIYSSHKRR